MEANCNRVAWREKRRDAHTRGRPVAPADLSEQLLLNQQQIEEAARCLTKKEKRAVVLCQLTHTFSIRPDLIIHFIKLNTSMPTLISLMTGSDIELQTEAISCLTNMAFASDDDVNLICKMAAPYLVTYLSGSHHMLQDQSAWCIGNLAVDSVLRCDHLVSLGVLPLLVELLRSSSPGVVQSAAFAVARFAKTEKYIDGLLEAGVLAALVRGELFIQKDDIMLTEVAWIVFYICARSQYIQHIKATDLPPKLADLFVSKVTNNIHKYQILTPLIRCLGNMCCDLEMTTRILECEGILQHIGQVMTSAPDAHIRKESIWLLTNMTVHHKCSERVVAAGLVKAIVHSLASTDHIKIQACQCLCNMLSGSATYHEAVHVEGTIQCVVPLLSHPAPQVVMATLCLTQLLLTNTQHLSVFDSCKGRETLEHLMSDYEQQVNTYSEGCDDTTTTTQLSIMVRDLLTIYY